MSINDKGILSRMNNDKLIYDQISKLCVRVIFEIIKIETGKKLNLKHILEIFQNIKSKKRSNVINLALTRIYSRKKMFKIISIAKLN